MLGHHRLDEQRALLRIDAGGDPVGGVVEGAGRDLRRVRVLAGQRVPVGHEVEAVERILELDPVAQRADQVPEMELSRRAHPRHDTFLHTHHNRRTARKLMGGCTMYDQRPGQEQGVEGDEPVLPRQFVEGEARPQRQQVREHLAAVERRDRDHVEHRQAEVRAQADAEILPERPAWAVRTRTGIQPASHDTLIRTRDHDGQQDVAGRTGQRDQDHVAPRPRQVAHLERHRLRPADQRHPGAGAANSIPPAETGPCRSGRCGPRGSATPGPRCRPWGRRAARPSRRAPSRAR